MVVASPVLFAVGLFIAHQQLWDGMAIWVNASNATAASVTIIGPLAASIAAFDAARRKTHQLQTSWDTSLVGADRASLAILASSIFWNLCIYVLIAAWVLVPVAFSGAWGMPLWPVLVSGLVGQCVAVALGHVLGSLVPRRFMAVLAAPITYGAIVLFLFLSAQRNPRFLQLSFAPQNVLEVYYEPNYALLWNQAVWLSICLVFLAAVTSLIFSLRITTGAVASIFLVLAVVAASLVLTSQKAPSIIAAGKVEFECSGKDTQLCFHPAYKNVSDEIIQALESSNQRAEDTPFESQRVWLTQRGPFSHEIPSEDRVVHIDNMSDGWSEKAIVEMFEESEVYGVGKSVCQVQGTSGKKSFTFGLGLVVASWVAGSDFTSELPDSSENLLADDFKSLPNNQKTTWINDHLDDICST